MKKYFLFLAFLFLVSFANAECYPNYVCGEWSECIDGLETRTCVDNKCGTEDIIERSFCGQADCKSEIVCEEWSACNLFEKVEDLLQEELRFEGYKERICKDVANCVNSFRETDPCSIAVPIKVKETERCNKKLVEIFDDRNNLVGRVSKSEIYKGFNKIDISFVEDVKTDYCSYCFDGVQNYDETDVDCGGPSCPICIAEVEFFDWVYFVVLFSWAIIWLFLAVFFMSSLVIINREGNFLENVKHFLSLFKPLTAEEARAREEMIKRWFRGDTI